MACHRTAVFHGASGPVGVWSRSIRAPVVGETGLARKGFSARATRVQAGVSSGYEVRVAELRRLYIDGVAPGGDAPRLCPTDLKRRTGFVVVEVLFWQLPGPGLLRL